MEMLNEKYQSVLKNYGINTELRVQHFMAQIEHESNLKPIQENLNYSKEGLIKTFPKYFTKDTFDKNGKLIKSGTSTIHAYNPKEIANIVYANRMGNGDASTNDGWKYKGRGFIQLTGKSNYEQFSKDTGIDVLNNPDLLLEEANAMVSAIWFWNKNNLNSLADKDDIIGITKKINGGINGIEHRKQLLLKYKKLI